MSEPARRKLIFFASSDPETDPGPARNAYHFAAVASRSGLVAEVRLAGDAVKVAGMSPAGTAPLVQELREKALAGKTADFDVSL